MTTNAELRALMTIAKELPLITKALEDIATSLREKS